jgi:hypothetical protein
MEPVRRFTTFNQLYSDETRDPCHINYGRIMTRFDADSPTPTDSNTLWNQVIGVGGSQLQAYLCCRTGIGGRGPRIYCLHLPTKFIPALDGQESPWDNLTFAFLGEVMQGHVTNVVVPQEAFDKVEVWAHNYGQFR